MTRGFALLLVAWALTMLGLLGYGTRRWSLPARLGWWLFSFAVIALWSVALVTMGMRR